MAIALEDVNILTAPYRDRYPELTNYLDVIVPGEEWEGMRPRRNLLAGNVIVRGSESPVKLLGGIHAQFHSANNLVTNDDPGFVAFARRNFNLRADSDVFKRIPGFQPVPFDRMGTYVDEFRAVVGGRNRPR